MLVRNDLLKFLNIISKLLWKYNTFFKFKFLSRKCVKSDIVLTAAVVPTITSAVAVTTAAPAKGATAAADATATAAADATAATNGDDIAL